MTTNEFERDLDDQAGLKRPGRIDMRVFQNTPDAGDGHPGVQRCFRNYLHEGGMGKDLQLVGFGIKGTSVNINNVELQQLSNIGASVITVSIWSQIDNIEATTISPAQWVYVGGADQSVKQADSPTFGGLTVNGNITVSGNVDSVDISGLKTAYDAHAANTANPHTVTLDQAFDGGKIINGSDSAANAFQVGNPTEYLKMYEDGILYLVANDHFVIKVTSNNAIDFHTNNIARWNVSQSGSFFPLASNAYDVGSTTYEVREIYCCGTVNDTTCADFSNYSYDKLYNMFAQIKPMDDGGLHIDACRDDIYYPHIDFTTLPKEFSVPADKDMSKKRNLWELNKKGKIIFREVHYKKGDTLGIIAGNHQYALASLVVKMGEKIKVLESKIRELEK